MRAIRGIVDVVLAVGFIVMLGTFLFFDLTLLFLSDVVLEHVAIPASLFSILLPFSSFVVACWTIVAVRLLLSPDSPSPGLLLVANPFVHILAMLPAGCYGFLALRGTVGPASLIGTIAVATLLVSSTSACVQFAAVARLRTTSRYLKLATLLNALGVAVVFATAFLLGSRDWDLAGIIVMIGGAGIGLMFFVVSAHSALVACLQTLPSPGRTFRRAVIPCGLMVALYAISGIYYYPLAIRLQRALDTPDEALALRVQVRRLWPVFRDGVSRRSRWLSSACPAGLF